MQQFTLPKDALQKIRRRTLQKTLPALLIALIIASGIIVWNNPKDPFFVFYLVLILLFSFTFLTWRSLKRIKEHAIGYYLSITATTISKSSLHKPDIIILIENVTGIYKTADGNFIVKGKKKTELIGIPKEISNSSELEAMLTNIKKVQPLPTLFSLSRLSILVFLIVSVIMLFTTSNKTIMIACAIIIIGYFLWKAYYQIQSDKSKLKTTILSLFIIIIFLALKLKGII